MHRARVCELFNVGHHQCHHYDFYKDQYYLVDTTITKVKVALMHVVLKIGRKSTIKVFTSQLTSIM
jgi:hypothetical protein